MPIQDVTQQIRFAEKFTPRILQSDERAKVVLVCLEPGQKIPAHKEDNQGVFYVLEGAGIMSTDDGELPMKAGSLVTVAFGGTRGMRPEGGRLVVLATAVF